MRRIVAGLAGLGLIGGVGAVTYDESGTPTVTVDDHGTKSKVKLSMDDGKSFSCPDGIEAKLSPHDITAGRVKLTLQRVRAQEKGIEKRYPGRTASKAVVDRYNKLHDRDDRLVDAYNDAIDQRNAILKSDCTAS